jgi:acetylornithine deacetylase
VRFNTVSRESNLPLIECIADHLRTLGVPPRLTWDDERRKANLFATLGEGKPGGVILSGHTDTVPWDGQAWTLDPLGADGARRPPVRPRQRRHEGLHRPGGGAGARLPGGRPAVRGALRLQLRRGGRLLRRAPPDRRPAGRRPGAARCASSANRPDGAGHRAQGRAPLALLRQGQGGAFVADAAAVNAIEAGARVVARMADMADRWRADGPARRASTCRAPPPRWA